MWEVLQPEGPLMNWSSETTQWNCVMMNYSVKVSPGSELIYCIVRLSMEWVSETQGNPDLHVSSKKSQAGSISLGGRSNSKPSSLTFLKNSEKGKGLYSIWDHNLQHEHHVVWRRLGTRDWDQKLLRKMFTDGINQVISHGLLQKLPSFYN